MLGYQQSVISIQITDHRSPPPPPPRAGRLPQQRRQQLIHFIGNRLYLRLCRRIAHLAGLFIHPVRVWLAWYKSELTALKSASKRSNEAVNSGVSLLRN